MRLGLALIAALAVACVDGTTPDCSTPDSGCFPGDGGSNPTDASDASDGGTDATKTDASSDAASDAAVD